jgi:hypothetical protein
VTSLGTKEQQGLRGCVSSVRVMAADGKAAAATIETVMAADGKAAVTPTDWMRPECLNQ